MATLEIGPHQVEIDDKFLSLTSAQQQATVQEIAKSLPAAAPQQQEGLTGDNIVRSVAQGVPLLGGLMDRFAAGADAITQPVLGRGSDAATLADRYAANRAAEDAKTTAFGQQHPIASTAANITGGIAATIPVAATATGARLLGLTGQTLGGQVARGAVANAALSGADAAIRGEPIGQSALIGGAIGAAVPVAARAIGSVAAGARELVTPPPRVPQNVGDFNVPISRGQASGDFSSIMSEQAALRGGLGEGPQRIAQSFADAQAQANNAAREGIAQRFNPAGNVVAENPIAAGELVSNAVQDKAAQARNVYKGLYNEVAQAPGDIPANAFGRVGNAVETRLANAAEPIILDNVTTPNATKALGDLKNRIGALDPSSSVSLAEVDQARKRLISFYQDAKAIPSDARATQGVIKAFDEHVQNVLDAGLFSGSPRVPQALKEARDAYASYRSIFTPKGAGDDVGRVMQKIVGRFDGQAATPTEISNYLYGANGIGANGLSVRLAQRLKQVLTPEEIAGVKQGLWAKLTTATEGATEFGTQKVTGRVAEFLNGKGAPLAHTLFTPAERTEIARYGQLQKMLTPPPGTVNHSNTAPILKKIMDGTAKNILGLIGIATHGPIGAIVGHGADVALRGVKSIAAERNTARMFNQSSERFSAQQAARARNLRLAQIAARGSTGQ